MVKIQVFHLKIFIFLEIYFFYDIKGYGKINLEGLNFSFSNIYIKFSILYIDINHINYIEVRKCFL
ncbi:MAG TPA: hypothetical protein DD791_03040 [Syntrophomonas sp.]|nr:hypothetical protein [Syntrophomonas sp.]